MAVRTGTGSGRPALNVLAGLGCVDPSIVGAQSEMSVLPIYDGMPDFRTALDAFGAAGFEVASMFAVSRDQWQRLVEFDCVMLRVSAVAAALETATPVMSHAST